jgi:hypothetical protein
MTLPSTKATGHPFFFGSAFFGPATSGHASSLSGIPSASASAADEKLERRVVLLERPLGARDDGVAEELRPDGQRPIEQAHARGRGDEDLAAERRLLEARIVRAPLEADLRGVREDPDVARRQNARLEAERAVAHVAVALSGRQVRLKPGGEGIAVGAVESHVAAEAQVTERRPRRRAGRPRATTRCCRRVAR